MKKLISIVAAISLFSNVCFGDCDFSKGITKLPDGSYQYTAACNLAAGQAVADNAVKAKQIADLNKAVQLKDLALTTADQRADNWMDSSLKQGEYIQKISSLQKEEFWIAFGLGILVTSAAITAAAQVINRH